MIIIMITTMVITVVIIIVIIIKIIVIIISTSYSPRNSTVTDWQAIGNGNLKSSDKNNNHNNSK